MKKFLTAVAILACTGTLALAGPNAGGTILVHYAPIPVPGEPMMVDGGLTACDQAVAQAPVDETVLWFAYAAFPQPCSAPRVKVVTFGCDFDMNYVGILWSTTYSDATVLTYDGPNGWPFPGSGKAIAFYNTLTAPVNEFYTFAGYAPDGYTFSLVPHPDPNLGGSFADDGSPSVLDPIAGYGTLGFGSAVGHVACPAPVLQGACCYPTGACEVLCESDCTGVFRGQGTVCVPNDCPQPPTGACCFPDYSCQVLTAQACADAGGSYLGDNVPCEPGTCYTPTEKTSWGQIKANYR